MKQPGLINSVSSAVGIEGDMAKGSYTPDGFVTLVKNDDGVPAGGSFNYSSILVIILHLFGYTCLDIAFAVNFYERYMFFPQAFV